MQGETRIRLDDLLVRRGEFATRSRARDAIERGAVRVDGRIAAKPGQSVPEAVPITVDDPAAAYVSRAALKLAAGLDTLSLDPAGKVALDLGASTGGFTQVLLKRGASRVWAVDVGHGQFDAALRADPRVRLREGLNARDLKPSDIEGDVPEIVVCDVSFISLTLALPPALALAGQGACGLFLVKPQFEAGRDAIGKGGLLKQPQQARPVAQRIAHWLDAMPDWRVLGLVDSPIAGGDGNREFLLGAVKDR